MQNETASKVKFRKMSFRNFNFFFLEDLRSVVGDERTGKDGWRGSCGLDALKITTE